MHVDASCIALGVVLTHAGEGEIDHVIDLMRRKLSKAKNNYSTTECEGLEMVYVLQSFKHYLLGAKLKMYTDHSVLKSLVKKPMLGGNIFRWLLLFQEYALESLCNLGHHSPTRKIFCTMDFPA